MAYLTWLGASEALAGCDSYATLGKRNNEISKRKILPQKRSTEDARETFGNLLDTVWTTLKAFVRLWGAAGKRNDEITKHKQLKK